MEERKKEKGRRKKEEGRRKKEEGIRQQRRLWRRAPLHRCVR
jgi:hypothetical protein